MPRLLVFALAAALTAGAASAQGLAGGSASSDALILFSDDAPDVRVQPLPMIEMAQQSRVFASSIGGFAINLSADPNSRWNARVAVDFRRDQGVADRLRARAEPEAGAELGIFGQFSVNQWQFAVDLRHDPQTDGRGTQAELGLFYGAQIGGNVSLALGPTMSLGGGDGRGYFGVTPAQLSRSRRGEADAGYGVRGTATYSLSENWALTGVLGYRRSFGEAVDSSLGDASQFFSILGFGYRF